MKLKFFTMLFFNYINTSKNEPFSPTNTAITIPEQRILNQTQTFAINFGQSKPNLLQKLRTPILLTASIPPFILSLLIIANLACQKEIKCPNKMNHLIYFDWFSISTLIAAGITLFEIVFFIIYQIISCCCCSKK